MLRVVIHTGDIRLYHLKELAMIIIHQTKTLSKYQLETQQWLGSPPGSKQLQPVPDGSTWLLGTWSSKGPLNDTQNQTKHCLGRYWHPNRASSLTIYDPWPLLKQLIMNNQSFILKPFPCHGFQQVIFQNWDRDGSGDISVAELTRVLKRLRLGCLGPWGKSPNYPWRFE